MSRIAVIDLGTNTFNLLVVEVDSTKLYTPVFQKKIAVKLAEGGIKKGFIAPKAFQRGIEALKEHHQTILKYKVETIHAFATSAIRGASNQIEFIEKVKSEIGIDIEVVSGDREAELIYYGVRNAVEMSDELSLIIDIGGGSTEFIIANKNEIFWKQSFLLGAARLLEMFDVSDPITVEQTKIYTNYLRKELQPLFDAVRKYPVKELLGSSGSFDSLAEMIAHRFYSPYILTAITEYTFKMDDFNATYETIIKSTTSERHQMKGLVSMRVDMIVISSIFVNFIISSFAIQKMRLSTYSLKEGVLHYILNQSV